ncbi:MAG: hypothetical protein ACRDV0_04690 [Acidimicrobiales bacterium]
MVVVACPKGVVVAVEVVVDVAEVLGAIDVVVVDAGLGARVDGVGASRDVTVKRRTRSSSGLDHMRTWPPARDRGLLAIRVRR